MKQAAADLQAAQEQLCQSQKMEAVGQLTGGVAHDFHNLLQVIAGNLHIVGKGIAGKQALERRVASAQAAVWLSAKLASQLLAFSQRQALEPKVVNVGKFVVGMEDLLRGAIGEAIEIETAVSGGLWNTFADAAQIENAILNVAINARDAMSGSGRLTIEVGNAFLDEDYARGHTDVAPGRTWCSSSATPVAAWTVTVIESGVAIDLLFTDIVMPGALKSPELARKARERLPRIAVLFASGYARNAIVHGGRLDPGVELLNKPCTRDALARQVLGARAREGGEPRKD